MKKTNYMNIYEKTIIYFLPQCQNILLKHFPIILRTDNLWKTLSPLYLHSFIYWAVYQWKTSNRYWRGAARKKHSTPQVKAPPALFFFYCTPAEPIHTPYFTKHHSHKKLWRGKNVSILICTLKLIWAFWLEFSLLLPIWNG